MIATSSWERLFEIEVNIVWGMTDVVLLILKRDTCLGGWYWLTVLQKNNWRMRKRRQKWGDIKLFILVVGQHNASYFHPPCKGSRTRRTGTTIYGPEPRIYRCARMNQRCSFAGFARSSDELKVKSTHHWDVSRCHIFRDREMSKRPRLALSCAVHNSLFDSPN